MPEGFGTGGFRSQQRFNDSGTGPVGGAPNGRHLRPPPEWTAATPPTGFPQPPAWVPPPVETVAPPAPPPTSNDLTTAHLLRPVKPPPSGGWRKWLYLASFKTLNVGESPRVAHRNNLLAQVNRPLQGCYRIALMSLKGGVGKTTMTAALGGTFASIRGDRVVAVDANPDRGTLSGKVPLETPATVRHLLRDAEGIDRYSDIRAYTSQGPSRLEVLASESDPAVS
ncbi:MAG: AAA family ATPase, partial [Mycobacteriaceae bacterium]|nr:AAA family ATPase [Mycobacteriaceae bacterium]